MLETTTKGIWIITDDTATEEVDGGKGGYDTGADYGSQLPDGRPGRKRSRISAEELRQSMEEFLVAIEETFEKAERSNCQMQLQELKLSVEINGKGQVSLLGTGGEAGAKGARTDIQAARWVRTGRSASGSIATTTSPTSVMRSGMLRR